MESIKSLECWEAFMIQKMFCGYSTRKQVNKSPLQSIPPHFTLGHRERNNPLSSFGCTKKGLRAYPISPIFRKFELFKLNFAGMSTKDHTKFCTK